MNFLLTIIIFYIFLPLTLAYLFIFIKNKSKKGMGLLKEIAREKDFEKNLFNEFLRFHIETTSRRDLDKENLGFDWRFYQNEESKSPFNVALSPYDEIIDEFIVFLVKKRKYDPMIVTDYFNQCPEEIYGEIGSRYLQDLA